MTKDTADGERVLLPCPFESRWHLDSDNGCWNWEGAKNNRGYGHLLYKGKHLLAHRFFYTKYVGPIPEGLTIDHQCKNRLCVNPKHLKAMTQKENNLLGDSPVAVNKRKTHCSNGHALTGANVKTVHRKDGVRRKCRKCNYLYTKRKRDEKRM